MGKIFFGIVSLALLIFLIVWLWQRQPSGPTQHITSQKIETESVQKQNAPATTKPQDNLVVSSQIIKIKGKLNPNDYLVIASNSFNKIVKTENTGNFEVEVTLEKGLNLIDYISISSDLKSINKSSLTYYYSTEKKFKSVYAGAVKSIFDNLITVSTPNGEINTHTSKTTELDIPQSEEELGIEESTSTALRNIRVGDYAITLGENSDQNSQMSGSLEIIRQNKPQNNAKILTSQIATSPKQNSFTAKNLADSKVVDLTISKETNVQLESQTSIASPSPKTTQNLQSQIIKDKNAIIIYHEEDDENIVDLVYQLP